jgi:hypothetical protein
MLVAFKERTTKKALKAAIIVFLTIKNDLCMSVYRHYDNSNQVVSFYKLPLSISIIMVSESSMNNPARYLPRLCPKCDDNVQALLPREENPKRTIRYPRPTPPVKQ